MEEMLNPLQQEHDNIQVRGKGMIIGLDVSTGDAAKAIVSACFDRRLLLGACGTGGRVVKLIPPLTIPEEDLKEGLNIVVEATREVMEEQP